MATLAESFLADLDELSDIEENEEEEEEIVIEGTHVPVEEDLDTVARLASSDRYVSIMAAVNEALSSRSSNGALSSPWDGPPEEDPAYKLIVDCNALAVDIENEIVSVYNFIRDKYKSKFPELESLVTSPLDYARVVAAIGNEMDATLVDLESLLPPAQVMVISVTATTTSGRPLDETVYSQVMQACDLAFKLDEDKLSIIKLVQLRMDRIAPNLSAALGPEIAAQLMGVAGGLMALARMPACNVQVLGAKRKHLAGFSTSTLSPHHGFLYTSDLIQNHTPPGLRNKAVRLIAGKCTLLARMDAFGQDPTGNAGQDMKDEMLKKIEKWQEPPPAKQNQVLPVPDAEKKKRRGGRRFRKMKEKYGMTELKKQANRMKFNQAEEEFMDGDDTLGLGVIGKEGSGRLRAVAVQQKQKLSAKAAKKYNIGKTYGGSGMATSGLASSLAFTPVQGIELVNPLAEQQSRDVVRKGTDSYFSEASGFKSRIYTKQP